MEITKDNIEGVFDSILNNINAQIETMSVNDLEKYWAFKWDDSHSVEWNTYEFNESLYLYGKKCKQWELYHNGGGLLVERVRDKYLMPKIKEFLKKIKESHGVI
jgi:hypothetical protein